MGALVSFIPGEMGEYEPLEDIGGYLGNWFTMMVARVRRHETLLDVANPSTIPIVNARTDKGYLVRSLETFNTSAATGERSKGSKWCLSGSQRTFV